MRGWATKAGQEQVIGQAELAPVALAFKKWQSRLRRRDVLLFVDNIGAADGLIKGASPNLASANLIGLAWLLIARLGANVWVSWVPGPSNPADAPSRLRFEDLVREGAVQQALTGEDLKWLSRGALAA